MGSIWYASLIQGPLQSIAWIQRVTHFNNWVIGHSHIAVLGFVGFIALGGMYYVLPYVSGRHVDSEKLVNVQYWLVLLGLIGFFIVLTASGLIQGELEHGGPISCCSADEAVHGTSVTLRNTDNRRRLCRPV